MSVARPVLVTAAAAALAIVALGFFARPVANRDATRVVAVRAGGGDVPANLLRVYVEFSASMEPGAAYEHLHLLDSAGREMKSVFLELREELWSADHRRLTILFDPGRVKRGIRSNVEMGAPLLAGQRYRLVIDSAWRDARNAPLASSYAQELRVRGVDSISPDPARWSLSSPRHGSHDALRVDFGEALDHALALRLVSVVDSSGARLLGSVDLDRSDRVWTFVPVGPWPIGARLRVEPALEDLAGNNLVRPFDVDRLHGGRSAEQAIADTSARLVPIP